MKYSDRGLVVHGRISSLFEQLYLTVTVGVSLMYYMVGLSRHFYSRTNQNQSEEPIFLRNIANS